MLPSIIDDLGALAKVQLFDLQIHLFLLVMHAFFYLAPGRSPCSPTGSKKGWMPNDFVPWQTENLPHSPPVEIPTNNGREEQRVFPAPKEVLAPTAHQRSPTDSKQRESCGSLAWLGKWEWGQFKQFSRPTGAGEKCGQATTPVARRWHFRYCKAKIFHTIYQST
jgi:hypothetical protein